MQPTPEGYLKGTGNRRTTATNKHESVYSGQALQDSPQHVAGCVDCPACEELRQMYACSLPATLSFAEAAALYMRMRSVDATPGAAVSARYIKPNTMRSYEQYIRSLSLFFGPMPLEKIHLGHLREYQMARVEGRAPFVRYRRPQDAKDRLLNGVRIPANGKTACPAKPAQVNKELCLLKMILRRALAWTPQMEEFHADLDTASPEQPRALTPEEQARWLGTARSTERWALIYWYSLLAFDSTCSTDELRALRIGDVNLRYQTINVQEGKNRYRRRGVAIENADALWALEQLLDRAQSLGASGPRDYLFPSRDTRRNAFDATAPMSVSGLKRKWEEVRAASGLIWFRPYDTRHTGITRLAEQGVPIQIIMARAGHISPRMSQHYTQISDSAQRRWLRRPAGSEPVAMRSPTPQVATVAKMPSQRQGYTTIYVGGVPIVIPA